MSSLEHTKDSDQENEPMDYEVEYQKLKEENALLKQSLERERKRIAELKAHNRPLLAIGMCSDVTLLVEGKEMAVHQNVLSAHSPVFAALLNRQNENRVLVIGGTKVDTFEMLLRFIYTGQVPLLKRQAATELMAAAKDYQLEGLKKCLLGQLVTHLPDLCLAALFRQMTLEDQIDARKVCRRWADLVPETTSKRRELTLLLGEPPGNFNKYTHNTFDLSYGWKTLKFLLNADGTAMYPDRRLTSWNSLHVKSLDQTYAEEIASTFTGVKKLQLAICYSSQSTLDNLPYLLGHWSHQLATLQLLEDDIDDKTSTRLFAAINALSVLKHLHINIKDLPIPDLSIISQLEELHFSSPEIFRPPGEFIKWLQQYGNANRGLTRIEYDTLHSNEDYLEQITSLSEHLRSSFTRLSVFFEPFHDPAPICAHFSGLTSLYIYPANITVRQLFTPLATLRQLIHLELAIDSDFFLADDLEHLLLPQVKSLRALELMLYNTMPVHQQLAQLKLAWTLPNVEVIHLEFDNYRAAQGFNFHCIECNVDIISPSSAQAKDCLRQIFASLKRDCTKLRLIKHAEEDVHGTAEELLAK